MSLLSGLLPSAALIAALAGAEEPDRPVSAALCVAAPPLIDGRLDEAIWKQATPIGLLIQVEPIQGVPPSEATDVRILYDSDALYIGIRCFDRDPGAIRATQMGRDADLDPDDRVRIVIDTFHDRRNAFFFQMNPAGSKTDALISNNGQDENVAWDGIWEGKATIDEQGWTAEMALPFKTMSFKSGLDTWGFNVQRIIKRRLETDRWSGARQDIDFFQIAEAGEIRGLAGLQQGIGLDVKPFVVGTWSNDRSGEPDRDLTGRPGFDAFYKVTPSLTASLTVKTDFAETEVDQRQINLTRFPLFFPEKRDFFLENAGIFQFGDLNHDLIPFFSRRVGLTNEGAKVPILAGGKLTGREGGYNIGFLDVETDEISDTPERNLLAARVSRNVGEQSTIGGIFTRGNPSGTGQNVCYGLDGNFRTSTFRGDKNLTASVWGLRSYTTGESGNDLAYGASVGYPNDLWSWHLAFKEIQSHFNPALGFVPRSGIRKYTGQLAYEPRLNTDIRKLEFEVEPQVVTGADNEIQTAEADVKLLGIIMDAGDELRLEVRPSFERLEEDFEIKDGIVIPGGDYPFTRYRLEAESALKRPATVMGAVEVGEFYDGHRTDLEAGVEWRPSRYFTGSLAYEQNHVWLPEGHFTAHVDIARATIAFSPDISWSNFVQIDNESNTLGINSRWRWIVKPGQEVFLVFNETLERKNHAVDPLSQEVSLKIEYTLRF